MKYAIIALMSCSLLTACATAGFDELAVPDVVEYSIETQSKVAGEIEQNDIPNIIEFLKDYKVMRDQARAAISK